jgi:hypothetical protein
MNRWLKSTFVAVVLFSLCIARGGEPVETQGPVWKDAETGQILFTLDDIVAFDWGDQIFLLDLDAALDFLAWMHPGSLSRELLVEDEEGLIYRALWVSWASSVAFTGIPVYCPSLFGWTRFFYIAYGYPGSEVADPNEDARFNRRLRAALQRRGVLVDFDPDTISYRRFSIQHISTAWYVCGEDLKIRVDYFPEVFRSGEEARLHIFFAGGGQTEPSIDSLAVEIKFVANEGRYRSDVRLDNISPLVISERIYVCRFQPWKPCPGSVPVVESGSARVSLSILLCRDTESGPEVVSRLELPEQAVDVSAPSPSASANMKP